MLSSSVYLFFLATLAVDGSRRDGDFQNAIALMREQLIGPLDLVEGEPVGNHCAQIARGYDGRALATEASTGRGGVPARQHLMLSLVQVEAADEHQDYDSKRGRQQYAR